MVKLGNMITILGSSGFIGSRLAKRLTELHIDCFTPDRLTNLEGERLGQVIYCIGLTSDFRSRPFETVEAHVCKLLDVLTKCEFDSLLYLSSTRVYRPGVRIAREDDLITLASTNPNDLYNISKLMGESLALASSKEIRIARISNVYGDDFASDNFLSQIIKQALRGKRVTLRTSPGSEKDYVSIDDVVEGLINIATRGARGIYNVAGGANISNRTLLERVQQLTGCEVTFLPRAPKVSFPPISIERMRTEFGFQPANLLDDLEAVIALYRRNEDRNDQD